MVVLVFCSTIRGRKCLKHHFSLCGKNLTETFKNKLLFYGVMNRRNFLEMVALATGNFACGGYNQSIPRETNLASRALHEPPVAEEPQGHYSEEEHCFIYDNPRFLDPWCGIENRELCEENISRPYNPRMELEQMVVDVRVYNADNYYFGGGNGVLAAGRLGGTAVITAYHVVNDAARIAIYSPALDREYPAQVALFDENLDIALLIVDEQNTADLRRCFSHIYPHLNTAIVTDAPFNAYVGSYDPLLREVVVSRTVVTRVHEGIIDLEHTDTIYGDSGSPVFYLDGDRLQLLGILTNFGDDYTSSRAVHAESFINLLWELQRGNWR